MNKKMRELLEQINNKKEEARNFLAENNIDEAKKVRDEIKNLQDKFDVMKDVYEEEKKKVQDQGKRIEQKPKNAVQEFANAARNKFKNQMRSDSDEDGGYTVPKDIQTKINEYRESKDALQTLVTVEPVSMPSGSRTFKKRSQQTGFVKVDEGGNIPEKATPQFTSLEYKVDKYAGFFSVTNELLKDSDQSITNTLIKWIGDESRVTRNKLILEVLAQKPKTEIAGIDEIKDTLNVKLDPAFRYTSTIVTNQDGFNWLDKQKDNDGNYLLQPSVSAPTGKQLFGVPVVMISNKDLPSDTTEGVKAPFIIGDLKEAVVLFDRETLSIRSSDTAGDAFLTDTNIFRAIEREDVKLRDEEAFVYGEVVIEEPAA